MSLSHATRSMNDASRLWGGPVRGADRPVFLSYAHRDRSHIEALAERLGAAGYPVWWDDRIDAGERLDDEIKRALHAARAVVVLWSAHAVASPWVQWEAAQAAKHGKLIPMAVPGLDLRDIPPPYNTLNTLWLSERDRLMAALTALGGR